MARISEAEKKLLKKVRDQRLTGSLMGLRQALEDIWSSDMPRMIQDYTDHGVSHAERVAEYALTLSDLAAGRSLTEKEAYLLLASIYLHDVGMQCDVIHMPDVKEKATGLGARFKCEMIAERSGGYSFEEQREVRRNHHLLTAAWIDVAYRTGKTVLGPAARTIPEDLVDDVMDICKHHTKLPIANCPASCMFDPHARKQLVAAILRMADELDIDSRRVSSLDVLRTFSLDPKNSVFWWLHNRTSISFYPTAGSIQLTIRLNPDDVKRYGPLVYTHFISEFKTKNRPVVAILNRYGFPLSINEEESKVVEHDRAEPLPFEIAAALQELDQSPDPLGGLAGEVRVWLESIRYEVSDTTTISDRLAQMVASFEQGTVKQRILVRCVGGEVTLSDVLDLDSVLDRKTPQGWLVSDYRVADRAREEAGKSDSVRVYTLSEFLRQLVWGPYFDALQDLVEANKIPELYVDLACQKQEINRDGDVTTREAYSSLDQYVDRWLTERGKTHISLLGEFGSGKTWFCQHYAYRQLMRYLKDPVRERLPLLIRLRAFAKATTVQQLINDTLLEYYHLDFVGSAFEVFQELNRRGKLLIILDGFDEMARKVDYQTVVDNFWELAKLVSENSKVILTSRSEYFRWAKESEKILGGNEYGRRTIVLKPPKFEVLYLERLSIPQIREVITRRMGTKNGRAVAEKILRNGNLAEMATKPILVELLLTVLDEVSPDALENKTQVYRYATEKLLLRNISTERTFTSTEDKVFFLEELAWEMLADDSLRIHFTDIPKHIKSYFGSKIVDQHELDMWDYDLRAQTLLHRDAAGYYEFAHKSLAEYFAAQRFCRLLRQKDYRVITDYGMHIHKLANVIPFMADSVEAVTWRQLKDVWNSGQDLVASELTLELPSLSDEALEKRQLKPGTRLYRANLAFLLGLLLLDLAVLRPDIAEGHGVREMASFRKGRKSPPELLRNLESRWTVVKNRGKRLGKMRRNA